MQLSIDQKDIDKFLMIGDKVLIKPKNPQSQTKTGLYLPPSVQQGEKIQAGYIIKTGPGYPLPSQSEEHDVWEKKKGEEAETHISFTPPDSTRKRIIRFVVGIAVTLLIQTGLKPLIGESLPASFLRYFIVVIWIVTVYPFLFSRKK